MAKKETAKENTGTVVLTIKYGEYEFIEDGDVGDDYLQTLSYQIKYKYKNDDKVKME